MGTVAKKYKKIHLTWSKHWLWFPLVSIVPMALLNLQCPGTITFYTVQSIASHQVDSGVIFLSKASSPSWGWSKDLPSGCGIPLCLLPPPGNGVDIGYTGMVSPIVEWAESSCSPLVCNGMMHCPLLATQHVPYIYYSSFLECSWFSYGFSCWLPASQLVLADGDVDVDVAVLGVRG